MAWFFLKDLHQEEQTERSGYISASYSFMLPICCLFVAYETILNQLKPILKENIKTLKVPVYKGLQTFEQKNKDGCKNRLLVQVVGIEPTRYHYHRILSPARLPVPPHLQVPCYDSTKGFICQHF